MLKSFIKAKRPDLTLLVLVIGISLFGLIMVYNASVMEAWQLFSDKYHFLKLQSLWLVIGLFFMLVMTYIPLELVKKSAPVLLIINLVLLIAVLIPGIGSQALGARRWLNLGPFSPQPTEITKLSLSIYLAAWLMKERSFWHYLLILALVLGLIMLQPDLGTAIVVVFSSISVYYISGANLFKLFILGIGGGLSGIGLIFSSSYRKERLLTFLNPAHDPLGSSYHIRQALIAIGSGGLFGLGLGQSRQKYQFLPQVTTDSIFAVIAEELGFIGAAVVIILLFVIIFHSFKIARDSSDNFSRLLAAGIASWLAIQVVINLAAMLSLLPLTGVPLPFISYGGSSLIITLTGIGLLLNISRYHVGAKKR
ncbi:MAG: putative lipid II flippase FtsW [Candidatus Beckwithbacteria bacterium]|nr:putative lipid II flippase FtsW [Candidatus Beckwithbacteria bacterium]